jgi:cell division protein FtsI/penicillin-binding protein 2
MSDTPLNENAKRKLETLAKDLPNLKFTEDSKGNREYKHKDVLPYVNPLLKDVGLEVGTFSLSFANEMLICLIGLELHCLDVLYLF